LKLPRVYGNNVDEILQMRRDLNGDDDFLDGYEVAYYHTNVQGNVVAVTDASGDVIEKIEYDLYGRMTKAWVGSDQTEVFDPISQSGGFLTASEYYTGSLTKNPYLFQGRRLDEESGLYYFRNRQYDPVYGRFLSRDPIGYADSMNLYSFVNNNPICYVDPFGLKKGDSEALVQVISIEMKYRQQPKQGLDMEVLYSSAMAVKELEFSLSLAFGEIADSGSKEDVKPGVNIIHLQGDGFSRPVYLKMTAIGECEGTNDRDLIFFSTTKSKGQSKEGYLKGWSTNAGFSGMGIKYTARYWYHRLIASDSDTGSPVSMTGYVLYGRVSGSLHHSDEQYVEEMGFVGSINIYGFGDMKMFDYVDTQGSIIPAGFYEREEKAFVAKPGSGLSLEVDLAVVGEGIGGFLAEEKFDLED